MERIHISPVLCEGGVVKRRVGAAVLLLVVSSRALTPEKKESLQGMRWTCTLSAHSPLSSSSPSFSTYNSFTPNTACSFISVWPLLRVRLAATPPSVTTCPSWLTDLTTSGFKLVPLGRFKHTSWSDCNCTTHLDFSTWTSRQDSECSGSVM
ncbi:hypothetical protein E2C01_034900 [Portunus trituberculatus]|uniref:Uncharacterized protein n=1 Tax=Portunus trituberculatus TaxID=210409 RepID=A0A5B7F427_PORTR|nr:hypothetical protein [Portunus trituberculatus]